MDAERHDARTAPGTDVSVWMSDDGGWYITVGDGLPVMIEEWREISQFIQAHTNERAV